MVLFLGLRLPKALQIPSFNSTPRVKCRFYDELGLRMMRGTPCRLIVETGDECVEQAGRITDLYTEGTAEYIRLDGGTTIRLDHIVRIEQEERKPKEEAHQPGARP